MTEEMYAATATTPAPIDGCAIGVRETDWSAAVGVVDVDSVEPGDMVDDNVGLAVGEGVVEGESDGGTAVALGVLEGESVEVGVDDGDVPIDCDDEGVEDDEGVGDAVSVDVAVAVETTERVAGDEPVPDESALAELVGEAKGDDEDEAEVCLEGVVETLPLAVSVCATEADGEAAPDATEATVYVPEAAADADDVSVGDVDENALDDAPRVVVERALLDIVWLSLCVNVARPVVDGLPLSDMSWDGVEDAEADLDPPRMLCEAIVWVESTDCCGDRVADTVAVRPPLAEGD